MSSYRVTKYNPAYRNAEGAYLKDEWISSSDIWNPNVTLDIEEYLKTEDEYWKVVLNFLQLAPVESLTIMGLEVYGVSDQMPEQLLSDIKVPVSSLMNGQRLSTKEEIEEIFRLCMREIIWCKLVGDSDTYIHFGYDYYVYFGTSRKLSLTTMSTPLFIETCESPH